MVTLQDLKYTPKRLWIFKILDRFKDLLSATIYLKRDVKETSFILSKSNLRHSAFFSNVDFYEYKSDYYSFNLFERYCDHKFDILGNGWKVSRNEHYVENKNDNSGNWLNKVVNRSNLDRSKEIWSELIKIDPTYQPIDWQMDSGSGNRFDSKRWYKSSLVGIPENTDIKVPWELARLQHIIRMLLSSLKEQNFKKSSIEAQCQLLDFIMSNPPRWGANWRSTMDVSIRAANISMAINVLISELPDFQDTSCCAIIKSSLLDHYYHILNNDERKNGLGNNHYLSNIVGLLYTAYSFDEDFIIPSLNKYIHELFFEINKQFLPDGGNFESSTTYHALSIEICIYGMALVDRMQNKQYNGLNLSINKEDQEMALRRLKRAYKYLDAIINDDGVLPQLGDNDSGRFFKWTFHGKPLSEEEMKLKYHKTDQVGSENTEVDEDYLNYSSVLNLCKSYFGEYDVKTLEGELIRSISSKHPYNKIDEVKEEIKLSSGSKEELKYTNQTSIRITDSSQDNKQLNVELNSFQDTGVYILENDEIKVIINGTNCNVLQYWPHGHNDKLSFTVIYNGKQFFRDPGSYTYTGNTKLRNVYRSVNAHNSPNHGKEQNPWIEGKPGIFRLIPKSKVRMLSYSENSIKLSLIFNEIVHNREWIINNREIVIKDESNKPFDSNYYPEIYYSNGYGKMLAEFA